MSNLTITIEAPEIVAAINHLAEAVSKITAAPADSNPTQTLPAASTVPTVVTPEPFPVTATVTPPVAPAVAAPAPTIPVSNAPSYTLDRISRAGAALVDAGKIDQLTSLLAKYGVQAITQLAADQYGVFAGELRALGAQI